MIDQKNIQNKRQKLYIHEEDPLTVIYHSEGECYATKDFIFIFILLLKLNFREKKL